MARYEKVLLIILAVSLSLVLVSRGARASEAMDLIRADIEKVVKIVPVLGDPPHDECTCPDHDMCMMMMGCMETCPMDMGMCEMMGDCHGGGSPSAPGPQQR